MKSMTSTELTQRRVFGTLQIIVSGIVLVCLLILILGLLKSRQCRTQPFNIYIIGIEFADIIMNLTFVIISIWYWLTSTQEALDQTTPLFWKITKTTIVFSTTANMWCNGVVGYQVYRLLKNSHQARRVNAPTIRRVLIELTCVYIFAGGLAGLFVYAGNQQDSLVLDSDNSTVINGASGAVLYMTIFGPILPLLYISYVCIQIYRNNLLPITGRTRTIAIYFARIVLVFFVFYLPGTIFFVSGLASSEVGWLRNIGTLIFALQGGFSFWVALKKPDVHHAVLEEFLGQSWICCNHESCCCCRKRDKTATTTLSVNHIITSTHEDTGGYDRELTSSNNDLFGSGGGSNVIGTDAARFANNIDVVPNYSDRQQQQQEPTSNELEQSIKSTIATSQRRPSPGLQEIASSFAEYPTS